MNSTRPARTPVGPRSFLQAILEGQKPSTPPQGQAATAKGTRRGAGKTLASETSVSKNRHPLAASIRGAETGASVRATKDSSAEVRQARARAGEASLPGSAPAKEKIRPTRAVTLNQLIDALDKKRIALERAPLTSRQKSRLKEAWAHHGQVGLAKPDRYRPLLKRIETTDETTRDRLKLASVLPRIEKANDEPYTTGERTFKRVDNNCEFKGPSGRELTCADFSGAAADDVLASPDRKSDARQYATEQAIQFRFADSNSRTRFVALRENAPIKGLIHRDDFGKFLARQFAQMERGARGRDRTRAGLVVFGFHATTVWLKLTHRDGQARYVVNFADANRANGHRRLQKTDASAIEKYGLADFVKPESLYDCYFDKGDESCAIYVHDADDPATKATCTIETTFTPQTVHHMLDGNLPFDVDRAVDFLGQCSTADAARILHANMTDAPAGMIQGMCNGSAEAVQRFGQVLVRVLDEHHPALRAQVATFLSPKHEGVNALFMGLRLGSPDVVRAFGGLVLELRRRKLIPESQVEQLLSSCNAEGASGLYCAARAGRPATVDAFLDTLRNVRSKHRVSLLAMTTEDGGCGIAHALRNYPSKSAGELFGVLRRAHEKGVITLHQLAGMSTHPDFRQAIDDSANPQAATKAYRTHLDAVLGLINEAQAPDAALGHLGNSLTMIAMNLR